jgi:hypothetical protein
MARLGRAADVAFAGQRDQETQLAQEHGDPDRGRPESQRVAGSS